MALPPDEATLDLIEPLAGSCADFLEVAPETLWHSDAAGGPVPNGFHRRLLALGRKLGKPFVAHGVGLSVAGNSPDDRRRRRTWMARIAADQKLFRFRWYTDHLGISAPDGQACALPLPVPMTAYAAALISRRLRRLAAIVPVVGLENTAQYFVLGDPLEEPAFVAAALDADASWLLLDVHNVHTMAINLGFDPRAYLQRLPLHKVIEIHVSGGSWSDPHWLRSGRRVRLDSHDALVPEAVWSLFEHVRPRCPHLRGVTLERVEGSVSDADVPRLRDELLRLRKAVRR